MISTLSTPGIAGAFVAADGIEVGSPAGTGVAVDQDGDGVGSPAEVGSAGTPSGNQLGSNPLNAWSTPEVCDMTLAGLPVAIVVSVGSSITYTETTAGDGSLVGLAIDAVSGNVTLNGLAVDGPLSLVGPPQTLDACKAGRWQAFNFPAPFKNQGDGVSYVATRRAN